jgi:two-component system cell cycle sensor histidine kinase PleC
MNLLASLSTREEPRYRTERLKQVVASLPPSIIINPVAAVVLFIPFWFWGNAFGHIPESHLAIATAMHVMLSSLVFLIWRRDRPSIANEDRTEAQLVVLQSVLSVAWGVTGWLYWQVDNGTNNIYITMILVGVVWAVMANRLVHTAIFVAGVLPLVTVFWYRIHTATGTVPALLAVFLPFWAAYILMMGHRGRQKIDEQLKMQFTNEDLQAALRASTEEALRKRYEAEAANSAKTTFLANMSHELRTPLNAILGFSDIIAQQALGPSAGDRYSEYARDINASGTHLLSLITDLLDVAKIEAGKMEIDARPLDVERLIETTERLMLPRARARNQSIRHTVTPDVPLVVADERAMRQILLNLLSNAVKFTPEGGRIEIACRPSPGGGVTLSVSDNGPGIPLEKMERVFQPFSQLDNRYGRAAGGTGLGLALVRGLAELHGGRAWIDSTLGEGTTVNVYFPLGMEPPRRAAVANG